MRCQGTIEGEPFIAFESIVVKSIKRALEKTNNDDGINGRTDERTDGDGDGVKRDTIRMWSTIRIRGRTNCGKVNKQYTEL
ncbi:hypothetical protein RB195_007851 [Necator americanus]|uniref:Uncharacterized protein n=1 Tax=Necator americanus TaxID=51031 RepID=A0ABR1C2K4_NECAM